MEFLLAKKKTTTRKKTVSKKSPTRKKSSVTKKATTKKKVAKKVTQKKVTKKKVTKKKAAVKKSAVKKVTKKKVAKKKAVTKKVAVKKVAKKAAVVKAPAKPKWPADPMSLPFEEVVQLDWTEAKLRKVKSGLTKKDRDSYKKQLLERRAQIVGDVRGMEKSRSDSLNDIAHMPLHMADVGSDNFEQELTLGLIESERALLIQIDAALDRIDRRIYGVCLESGRPIGKARLEFKPWAKYCIEIAREREKRGL